MYLADSGMTITYICFYVCVLMLDEYVYSVCFLNTDVATCIASTLGGVYCATG